MDKLTTYIKDPYKIFAGVLRRVAPLIKDDAAYLKILYYLRMHRKLHLENPQTFSEKLQWLKLYNRRPEYTMMVDKYAVKDYVANIIGKEYVIPTLGVWERPEDIEWESLPNQFVLKTTHGGGSVGVVICRNKETFDKEKAIRLLKKSLKQDIYAELREWPYKNVRKRIIAEPLMVNDGQENGDLPDYKFFCFNGEPHYCQVIKDRHTEETIDFFDVDWQHQEFVGLNPAAGPAAGPAAVCPSKPLLYDKMLQIAKMLSENTPFSRIDLYEIKGKVYFGEITFYPASGMGVFRPDKYNEVLGQMINLPIDNKI